jgi:hypothetical protein
MTLFKDIKNDEYAPYYGRYLSDFDAGLTIDMVLNDSLQHTLDFVKKIERPLSYSYQPKKWSIGQVLQHTIDTERVFAYRALRFLRKDPTVLSGFDHVFFNNQFDNYAFAKAELIQSITTTRLFTIDVFKNASDEALIFKGTANGKIMTARVIPFIIAGHFLHHEKVLKDLYL